MATQLCYEDIEIGDPLPALTKRPTTRQMVMWAGVSGDYYEIHYDKDFALRLGLPNTLVQAGLVASFLAQLVTDWMGESGILKRLSTTNRQMLFPNQDIACRGRVTKKYPQDGEHYVECEVWAENDKGEKAVLGVSLVTLPSRTGTIAMR